MSGVHARVLADSLNAATNDRLTTVEVRIHRFVLAEFNTHRALSRNSASSRAIPVRKQLAMVRDDPAVPLSWPAEQSGMQGGSELDEADRRYAERTWLTARDNAVESAELMTAVGVHKSVTNRLLEPFMWHTVLASGTQDGWSNFFEQRCSPLAQPEIRAAAEAIREAMLDSFPTVLGPTEWHTPLITPEDPQDAFLSEQERLRVSAARCARVSYLTHEGKRDSAEDLRLYERLTVAEPPHWSPPGARRDPGR